MLDTTEATHDDSDPELLLAFKNKPIKKFARQNLSKSQSNKRAALNVSSNELFEPKRQGTKRRKIN
jgi:hypothetical protein